ncbi:hypothetical protein [Endozoicomonas elysicola]|uniref:Lipoprotein n=1 Tax=Endozoicomonas elysicola TaxID=305900 RepID=A0A081K5X7_9GAMM|nr:hypothetical protein [Endozoicomonas elysicola]KEI69553.1 hypothetical protein GV64_01290 [Endozoicomonas elysicola]
MKNVFSGMLVSLALFLAGCASTQESQEVMAENSEVEVTRQFTGSTMTPDPVMQQVMELSKAGVLKNVRMTRSIPAQITATGPENVLACISSEGSRWLEEQQECEYMAEEICAELGGDFDPCASACRNDPEAMVCVLMCVQVCSFAE